MADFGSREGRREEAGSSRLRRRSGDDELRPDEANGVAATGGCEDGGCRAEEEEARPRHGRKEASDRDLLSRSNLEEATARWIECSGSGRRGSGSRWWVEEK